MTNSQRNLVIVRYATSVLFALFCLAALGIIVIVLVSI